MHIAHNLIEVFDAHRKTILREPLYLNITYQIWVNTTNSQFLESEVIVMKLGYRTPGIDTLTLNVSLL